VKSAEEFNEKGNQHVITVHCSLYCVSRRPNNKDSLGYGLDVDDKDLRISKFQIFKTLLVTSIY